jgi:hypothetical protein
MTTNPFANLVIRQQLAADKFVDYVVSTIGCSVDDALLLLQTYLKAKVIKLNPASGAFTVTHGAFLDAETLLDVLHNRTAK